MKANICSRSFSVSRKIINNHKYLESKPFSFWYRSLFALNGIISRKKRFRHAQSGLVSVETNNLLQCLHLALQLCHVASEVQDSMLKLGRFIAIKIKFSIHKFKCVPRDKKLGLYLRTEPKTDPIACTVTAQSAHGHLN